MESIWHEKYHYEKPGELNDWHPVYIHLHSIWYYTFAWRSPKHVQVQGPWIGCRIGKDAIDILGGRGPHNPHWLVVGPPLWKIWKSIGMMTFPIYGKIWENKKWQPNHQPAPYLRNHPWCAFGKEDACLLHCTIYHHSHEMIWGIFGWKPPPSINQPMEKDIPIESISSLDLDLCCLKFPWCPSCHVLSKMLRIHLRHVFLKWRPIWPINSPCSCDFKNAWNHRFIDWNDWNRFHWTPYFSRSRFHCIDWEVPDGNFCFGV